MLTVHSPSTTVTLVSVLEKPTPKATQLSAWGPSRQQHDAGQLQAHSTHQLHDKRSAFAGVHRLARIYNPGGPVSQDTWPEQQQEDPKELPNRQHLLCQAWQLDKQQQQQHSIRHGPEQKHVDSRCVDEAQRKDFVNGSSLAKAYLRELQQHTQWQKQKQLQQRHITRSGSRNQSSTHSSRKTASIFVTPAWSAADWQQLLQHTEAALQQLQPQQASLILYAIAKLGRQVPVALLAGLMQQLQQPQMQQLPPAGLTNVIWALAVLNYLPPNVIQWFSSFYAVGSSMLQQKQFNHHQLTSLLWSVGKLKQQPPAAWVAAVLSALRPGLGLLSPTQLSNTIWGLSQIGYKPDKPWCKAWFRASYAALPQCNPHHLACIIGSLGLLRLSTTNGRWMVCFRSSVQHQLLQLEAGQIATMMCGLAKQLSSQPPHWVTLLLKWQLQLLGQQPVAVQQTAAAAHQFIGQPAAEVAGALSVLTAAQQHKQQQPCRRTADIAATVWSLPRLLCPTPKSWGMVPSNAAHLRMLAAVSLPLLSDCSAGELVQLAVGFAGLSFHPGTHWLKVHENAIAAKYSQLNEYNKAKLRAAVKKLWLGG